MSVTLMDILRMPVMKESKLITAGYHLNTQVGCINIMESPDSVFWVGQNAVILTSLYCVSDNEEKMAEFLASLRDRPPCAFLIKLELFFDEVPPRLLSLAEELRFDIISISRNIAYPDIMYPVMAAMFESQVINLNTYKETQSLLTGYALKNAGVEGITYAFSELIGKPVCVYDRDMTQRFSTHPHLAGGEHQLLSEYREGDLHYMTFRLTTQEGKSYVQHLMPISVMESVTGYLGVIEKEYPLSELDFIAMQNAMTVLSMEMLKNFAIREVERGVRTEVIDEILSGANTQALWDRAASAGLYPYRAYAVVCIDHMLSEDFSRTTTTLWDVIGTLVQRCLDRHKMTGVMTTRNNGTVLFVQMPDSPRGRARESLLGLVRGIVDTLQQDTYIEKVAVGYSSRFELLEKVRENHMRACRALDASRIMKGACCDYEELGVFKLLGHAARGATITDMLPVGLHRLMEYDEKHKASLVQTLGSYFQASRNAKSAAQMLYIHPKTMLYRLNQISEIAGLDYKDHSQLLEMEFALHLLSMAGQKEEDIHPKK